MLVPKNSECVVITPFNNRIEPSVERGLRTLENKGYVVWREYGISAIDFARSLHATRAMAANFKETLWIDSDVEFDPDQVDLLRQMSWDDLKTTSINSQVASAVQKLSSYHSYPGVVCGLYVKKNLKGFAFQEPPLSKILNLGEGGGPVLMTNVGAGMMLVRDWVYNRIKDFHNLPVCTLRGDSTLVPYFLPMVTVDEDGQGTYLCEDYAFCERVRSAGIPIFADSTMRLFHLGTYGYSWEDINCPIERHPSYFIKFK